MLATITANDILSEKGTKTRKRFSSIHTRHGAKGVFLVYAYTRTVTLGRNCMASARDQTKYLPHSPDYKRVTFHLGHEPLCLRNLIIIGYIKNEDSMTWSRNCWRTPVVGLDSRLVERNGCMWENTWRES